MSLEMTWRRLASIALALCLAAGPAMSAFAAPSSAETAADRVALQRATEAYEAAQAESARIDAKLAATSARLDAAVAQESAARDRLTTRVRAMYRSPGDSFISVLLGASTVQEFVTRWDLLARIARRDAQDLRTVRETRAEIERSSADLLDLQASSARSLDSLAQAVSGARAELAASQAALAEYEARVAASKKAASPKASSAPAPDSNQRLVGSGAWKTGVASHYGRTFTGRGASGEQIGPYSMIVAHKTLPFGTLVEIEYNGRRAVAKVADRGPFTAGRDFDLGPGVVRVLDFSGVHEIRYRIISR